MSEVDRETADRAARGVRPDLLGWGAIAGELGVTEKTARRWERLYGLPVVWFGSYASAYSDRLRACAMSLRRRAAAA